MRIDRTRTADSKARTMTRRTARATKSARVFLALAAFVADLPDSVERNALLSEVRAATGAI